MGVPSEESRKYLFLTPPATGELQPVYAITETLLCNDVNAQVYIASGSSFAKRFEGFRDSLPLNCQPRLCRIDLGKTDDAEDYSARMLKPDPAKRPDLFGSHRHARGDPRPFMRYWEVFAAGSEPERLATIRRIKCMLKELKPDMIIVDQIYGNPFDGIYLFFFLSVGQIGATDSLGPSAIRSTGLPFVVVAPGHPSFSAGVAHFTIGDLI